MSLAGCTRTQLEHRPPEVVAVEVKDTPPAELLACPRDPRPFPTGKDAVAVIPPQIRDPLKDLALVQRDTRAQLLRLIRWHLPGACFPVPAEGN